MTVRQCTRGAGCGGTGGGVSVVDGNGAGAGATRVRSTGKGEDPSAVGGDVTKVDMARGRVTVRESDGTCMNFRPRRRRFRPSSARNEEGELRNVLKEGPFLPLCSESARHVTR